MSTFFDKQNGICSDSCWSDYKNSGNNKIIDYNTYDKSTQLLDCESSKARVPEFMYDHPNLRGRPGYGLADPCLIDTYSEIVKNKDLMTHDKCKIQLNSRIFTSCPQMKGSTGDIEKELELLSGTDTNTYRCRKTLMELQLKHPIPLVDCMQDIQNPEHIVPMWINGGEDTRSYINRLNFNKNV